MPDTILTLTVHPRVVVNSRAGIGTQTADIFLLPDPYVYSYLNVKLIEVPLLGGGIPFTIEEGMLDLNEDWQGSGVFYSAHTGETTPPQGFYKITTAGSTSGTIQIGTSSGVGGNLGKHIRVSYTGIGSIVAAEDINELATGQMTAEEFTFTNNVTIPGKLTIAGDLDVQGAINKTTVDELDVKDSYLVLNSDGGAINDAGIKVAGTGGAIVPSIIWMNAAQRWEITGDISIPGGISMGAPTIPWASTANIGKIFFDADTDQYKGVIANAGTPKVIILG